MVERAVFRGGSHEAHVRLPSGELLRVTIANDGRPLGFSLDQGTPVNVHLPADALRVLRPTAPD
jgi:hypothetical protein